MSLLGHTTAHVSIQLWADIWGVFRGGLCHAHAWAAPCGYTCSFLLQQNVRTLLQVRVSRFKTQPHCSARRSCCLALCPAALRLYLLPIPREARSVLDATVLTGVWLRLVAVWIPAPSTTGSVAHLLMCFFVLWISPRQHLLSGVLPSSSR